MTEAELIKMIQIQRRNTNRDVSFSGDVTRRFTRFGGYWDRQMIRRVGIGVGASEVFLQKNEITFIWA